MSSIVPRHVPLHVRWPVLSLAQIASLIAVVGVVLGTYGFHRMVPNRGLLSNLYLSVQLITLNSGGVDFPNIALEAARWMAPIGTLSAVMATVAERLGRHLRSELLGMQLRRSTPHHAIVFGSGPDGQHIARTLAFMREHHDRAQRGGPVVLLDQVISETLRRDLQREGIQAIAMRDFSPATIAWLKPERAVQMIAAMADDDENITLAMELAAAYQITEAGALRVSALVRNDVRAGILEDSRLWPAQSPVRQVRVLNRQRTLARRFLMERPLETIRLPNGRRVPAQSVHLVLSGIDEWSEGILRQAAAQAHFPYVPQLRVHLVGPQAATWRTRLLSACPGLAQCVELSTHEVEDEQWVEGVWSLVSSGVADASWTVLTSFADPVHAQLQGLRLASMTQERFAGRVRIVVGRDANHRAGTWRIDSRVAQAIHEEALDDLATDARMQFGVRLDGLARRLHEEWYTQRLATAREHGESLEALPTARPWAELSEELRGFNRSPADHVWVKLRALALRSENTEFIAAANYLGSAWLQDDETRSTGPDQAVALALRTAEQAWVDMEPAFCEELARCEHARWCADRWLTGWRHDAERNDQLRRHSDLVPYDELTEAIKDRDRNQVRAVPTALRWTYAQST